MTDYEIKGDPSEIAKMMVGQDVNGDFHFAAIDQYTKTLGAIDSAHLKVHQGKSYMSSHVVTGVANTASVELLFTTVALNFPHVLTYITTIGDSSVEFFEDATITAAGTALSANNRNRNSTNTANMVVTHTPTLLTDGTSIHQDYVLGGRSGKATGGTDGFGDEVILKPDSKYLLRITNESGVDSTYIINTLWYE